MSTTAPTPLILAGFKGTPTPFARTTEKKPYVVREHLTERPFADLGRMLAMQQHPAGKGR